MSTKDAQDFVKKNYGMTASISGVNSDNYKDENRDETIATAYKDRDFLAKFSMLNVNNQNLRITVNENENSISSQWKETDANPKPTDLEKIVSTTNNYSIQHNYNPNTFLYSNYGKSSRMSGIIPFSWFTNIKKDTSYSSKLKPETSTKYEIGYKYNISNIFVQNDYSMLDINLFKTNIEDLIIAKDVNGGNGKGGITLEDVYNSSNAIAGISEPIQRSGYVTHDISMKYKPSTNSSWTYFVGVYNLTNKYYASHSSIAAKSNAELYRYEVGRDFKVSLKYEF